MNKYCRLIIASLVIVALFSCNSNKFDKDVSKVNVSIKIKRFDKDLFSYLPDSINKHIPELHNKYGEFLNLFGTNIINIGSVDNVLFPDYLNRFITDIGIEKIHKTCDEKFKNIDKIENDLNEAFKHYKYYFPEKAIPNIFTFISGYNQSVVTAENILGIGLDKYFGKYEDYDRLQIPRFIQRRMYEDLIVPDCMKAWAYAEFENKDDSKTLLSNMLYEGKVLYFLDAMLPDTPDSLKIGYSTKQLEFCDKSEKAMWLFLINHKLLFSTEYIQIKQYINDAPFTSSFTNESPGRTGTWLGWQIVKTYMNSNPNVTLTQLMNDNNYQAMLNKSKFKP